MWPQQLTVEATSNSWKEDSDVIATREQAVTRPEIGVNSAVKSRRKRRL